MQPTSIRVGLMREYTVPKKTHSLFLYKCFCNFDMQNKEEWHNKLNHSPTTVAQVKSFFPSLYFQVYTDSDYESRNVCPSVRRRQERWYSSGTYKEDKLQKKTDNLEACYFKQHNWVCHEMMTLFMFYQFSWHKRNAPMTNISAQNDFLPTKTLCTAMSESLFIFCEMRCLNTNLWTNARVYLCVTSHYVATVDTMSLLRLMSRCITTSLESHLAKKSFILVFWDVSLPLSEALQRQGGKETTFTSVLELSRADKRCK